MPDFNFSIFVKKLRKGKKHEAIIIVLVAIISSACNIVDILFNKFSKISIMLIALHCKRIVINK